MTLADLALPGGGSQLARPSQWWRLRDVSHLWLPPARFLSLVKSSGEPFFPLGVSPSQTKHNANTTHPDTGKSRMEMSGLANHLAKAWQTFSIRTKE